MSCVSFDPWWNLNLISEIYWGEWRLRQCLCSWAVEYSIWCLIVQHSLLLGHKIDRVSRTVRCFDSALLPCTNLVLNKAGRNVHLPVEQSNLHSIYVANYVCLLIGGLVHYMFVYTRKTVLVLIYIILCKGVCFLSCTVIVGVGFGKFS
jgi:hypothetical protein